MSNCNWPDLDGISLSPTLESSSNTLNYYNNNPNPNNNPPMMPSNNNDNMWNLNYNSSTEEDYYTPPLLMNNLNFFPSPLITSLSTNPTLDSTTNNGPLQVINPTISSTLHRTPQLGMLRPPHQYEGGEENQQQGYTFLLKSEVDVVYDGYCWRKYGEKNIKNRIHPRSYYKCAHCGCKIRKQVERSSDDPTVVRTTYYGHHTHEATTNFLRYFQLQMIATMPGIPSS